MAGMDPASLAVKTAQESTEVYALGSTQPADDRPVTYNGMFADVEPSVTVKLSILMAAFNEQKTIRRAVLGILRASYPCDIELIVVDDGSADQTREILDTIRDHRLRVHRHATNQGKGASILTAASLATGTHIVPFDADLEYDPQDLAKMIIPVLAGRCDVVYGARLFGIHTVYTSYRYAMGNKLMTSLTNILYDSYLSDMHTCLKLIPLHTLRDMPLNQKRFGLDTQITAMLLRSGIRPFEVPVSYYSRSHSEGKKIGWRDAVQCVWILCKTRVRLGERRRRAKELQFTPAAERELTAGASEL